MGASGLRGVNESIQSTLCFRRPTVSNGSNMWDLARSVGLDENSPYAYLMFAKLFSETCIVAELGEDLVGFITGFRPPANADTLFIWQVGVAESHRGRSVATDMIVRLLRRSENADIRFVEATVTHSNAASQRLFRGLARKLGTGCEVTECFSAAQFPLGSGHEGELLFRIGPISRA